MPKKMDITGMKSSNLTAVRFSHKQKSKNYWLCKCECGNEKAFELSSIVRNRVKSCKRSCPSLENIAKRKEYIKSKVIIDSKECWNHQGKMHGNGYKGLMWLDKKGYQGAHRVSWKAYKGEIPKGMYICHKCDNKSCINPDHLYIGTAKDNSRDALQRGQFPKGPNKKKGSPGELNCKAKLNIEKVKYIRFLCDNKFNKGEIAKFFHVSESTIQRIAKRSSWQ